MVTLEVYKGFSSFQWVWFLIFFPQFGSFK